MSSVVTQRAEEEGAGRHLAVDARPSLDVLYERVRHVIPEVEWAIHAPLIEEILRLKKERNALILAHNYQSPEIFHGVADLKGDSLALARMAGESDADIIVMCGVHFMAETAKILNPHKKVLIPDAQAGCSLAEAINGEDVRRLKARHPGVPVVTYVNTNAEVKAEADICCTSSNAVEVVESVGTRQVIFLPDEYLGRYVASCTDVEVILWKGRCEVHERFTAQDLQDYRACHPGIHIVAHPECPPEVLSEADFVGSTGGMIDHLKASLPAEAVLITECSMSDNVAVEIPETRFIRPCNLCPHMKRISLPRILDSLEKDRYPVEVDPALARRARRSVDRMLEVGRGAAG